MRDHREFAACGIAAMLAVAGETLGGVVPVAVDTFSGAGWTLTGGGVPDPDSTEPPTNVALNYRGSGYEGVAQSRNAFALENAYLPSGFPTDFIDGTGGSSATNLNTVTRTLSVSSSGDGAVVLGYDGYDSSGNLFPFSVDGWEGIWMRYAVSSGTVQVNAWIGSNSGVYFAEQTLSEGSSGFLYFAFGSRAGATTFDVFGAPDLTEIQGITIQFRSADGDPMAMSVTGGIIPAPGAVAVVGLAGLMGRRRRN
jgi:hypothetical protein